ncbi:pentatricopeptide repeat-containing protein At5g04780, mitochondrial-like [Phragmites australis]|uniref:pentatricopeptide repeat-containing protein At5g04780, mitochondrial-like n=1 Tax=Phragmites australis TaxID=29695 RepID=UPI002D798BB4|nr:pentatricopeptide repeat-containing protein At5g04780, mitochondrial-like [Phragmites australis]
MIYAARKAAAALLSPPPSISSPSSPGLQLRVRGLCTRAIEAVSDQAPRGRGCVPSSWAKARDVHDARRKFDEIPVRSAPAWTATISGCARAGRHADGMRAFREMMAEGAAAPNAFVLAGVLRCCAGLGDVESGKRVHGWMLRNGVRSDVVLCNAVIDMYTKCGNHERAKRVFRAMAERDAVSWNIVISLCLQNGDVLGAMQLFDESPLRDTSSWNTIISGLMRNGCAAEALDRLRKMARDGVAFSHYSYSTAFALAGMLSVLDLGRQLHGRVVMAALDDDAFVRNSLMDMYCKCGAMEAALSLFDRWSQITGDVKFAWSTMVAGYIQNGREEEALEFFRRMLREGVAADQFTLTSAAAACANAGMVEQGRQLHGFVEKLGHGLDAPMASAFIDMYAKCGSLEDAHRIFDSARAMNVALWTAMLGSYASYGQGRMAIEFFNRMKSEKITPNEITFVAVLSACSHNGLVSEGDHFFKLMQEDYGIVPSTEHYNCMVDLYGRAGLVEKAKNFIEENNINHEAIVWKTLLSACRLHKHIEYAKLASEKLIQLEQCDAGSYVLMSNMYATNSKWLDIFKLRSSMRERRVRKQPGQSWIHLRNAVHTFVAGDMLHPRSAEIYAYLEKLMERLHEMGYTSRIDLVVHDVEEEQRETTLKFHSEKLAIAFGIISTPIGAPLRIFKNLRVCEDCHEAIKFISRAAGREIVVRDLYRFHHFKDGRCSCEDFW